MLLLLRRDGHTQLVYKHAISTVMPGAPIQLFDASKVQSSGGALQSLAHPPFGLWTVGIVALGLAAYGVYMLAAAKYSRIVTR